MPIAEAHFNNFDTLKRAFDNDDVALLECTDAKTHEPVVALCMVNRIDGEYAFIPVAKLFEGNPYEQLIPPDLGS